MEVHQLLAWADLIAGIRAAHSPRPRGVIAVSHVARSFLARAPMESPMLDALAGIGQMRKLDDRRYGA